MNDFHPNASSEAGSERKEEALRDGIVQKAKKNGARYGGIIGGAIGLAVGAFVGELTGGLLFGRTGGIIGGISTGFAFSFIGVEHGYEAGGAIGRWVGKRKADRVIRAMRAQELIERKHLERTEEKKHAGENDRGLGEEKPREVAPQKREGFPGTGCEVVAANVQRGEMGIPSEEGAAVAGTKKARVKREV